MTILDKLENRYRKYGILSTKFQCKHRATCQSCLLPTPLRATTLEQVQGTFSQAKSAFVGDRYGNGVPRLLFVSLDPSRVLTDNDSEYTYVSKESRTPHGVQKGEMERAQRISANRATPSFRLRETNNMAECVLGMPIGPNIARYYAHANAVKCTVNKKGSRLQADNRLYENCRERNYLREEIEILAPDVIVSMGQRTMESVEYALAIQHGWDNVGCEKEVVLSNRRQALWLPIHHPRNAGGFYNEARNIWGNGKGREWEKFAERVRDFISNRDS